MAAPGPAEPRPPEPGLPAQGPPRRQAGIARQEARSLADVLRHHGRQLTLVFLGLLLPLWAFAELADEIHEREAIVFDAPLLHFAHALASPVMDRFFVVISELGYHYGVMPFDVMLVLGLALFRRFRASVFAAITLGGSALLNIGAKLLFARDRPALWESIVSELTYSFPSGHAMGSATLAWVLVLLAWHTRWRWPVMFGMTAFVLLVGFSRVYLGVHYPSDILAGWAVASAWAVACWLLAGLGRGRRGEGRRAA